MLSRVEHSLFGEAEATPTFIAHYEIIRRVGFGGMGVVYSARDTKLDRVVALKLVKRASLSDPSRALLVQEARALAKLSHPNVVQVFEVGEHDRDVYVAMEFVAGENLARWPRQAQRSWRELLAVYMQAGAGLQAAHTEGIVHRDFKPANVLIGDDGRVKVADFGLARERSSELVETAPQAASSRRNSSSTSLVGTPGYIAPELWAGSSADARSDQYAFCVSLWEALSGRRPFGEGPREQPDGSGSPGRPRGPAWLRRALARGLSIDPARRWESVEVLLRELERAPKRRRFAGLGLGAAMAVGLLFLYSPQTANSCEFDPGVQIWTTDDTRKLSQQLEAAGLVGAKARAALFSSELEDYSARWAAARQSLCEAHHLDETLSARGLDLGHDCLVRARVRAGVVTRALFDEALLPGHGLDHGERLLDQLPSPQTCLRTSTLRPELGTTLASVPHNWLTEQRLGQIRVELASGRLDAAERMATALLMSEREQVTLAEAHLLVGRVQHQRGEAELAHASLREAGRQAELAGARELSLAVRLELTKLSARLIENQLDARSWLHQAQTILLGLGEPADLKIEYHLAEAELLEGEGQLTRSREALELVLAELELQGGSQRRRDEVLLRLANLRAGAGEHAEALRTYKQLLARQQELLGATHPTVGALSLNIGDSLVELGKWGAARPFLVRALDIEVSIYGRDSVPVATVETKLADVECELGDLERAEALASHAWGVQQRSLSPAHEEYGSALAALAWVHLVGEQFELALADHRTLLQALELDTEEQARVHLTIAWLLCQLDQCSGEVHEHLEIAQASDDEFVRLRAGASVAQAQLVAGDVEGCRATLERTASELLGSALADADPTLEVELELLRARAALASGELADARRHAAAALERGTLLTSIARSRAQQMFE